MKSIICIGSVLWDIIGRHSESQAVGFDVGGAISMLPGGVAMNIATALRKLDQDVLLLTYLGKDAPGDALIQAAEDQQMQTAYIDRADLPTDRYMAIEAGGNLFAAIADAHSLEQREVDVIAPLLDGRLGSADQPWASLIVLDGNLTEATLTHIATAPAFGAADIRLAPASPGKALRLRPFLSQRNTTIYVNLIEANSLLGRDYTDADDAAKALFDRGIRQAIVTDGANPCAAHCEIAQVKLRPPNVLVKRVTGAGDSFMAAHIAAQRTGQSPQAALHMAAEHAAQYISTE